MSSKATSTVSLVIQDDPSNLSHLLADDVLLHAFSFLSNRELLELGWVNRRFRQLSTRPHLWHHFAAEADAQFRADFEKRSKDNIGGQVGKYRLNFKYTSSDNEPSEFGALPVWIRQASLESDPRSLWCARNFGFLQCRKFLLRKLGRSSWKVVEEDGSSTKTHYRMSPEMTCERILVVVFLGVVPVVVLVGMVVLLALLLSLPGNRYVGAASAASFGVFVFCCAVSIGLHCAMHEVCLGIRKRRVGHVVWEFLGPLVMPATESVRKHSPDFDFERRIRDYGRRRPFFFEYGPVLSLLFTACCFFPSVGLGIALFPFLRLYSLFLPYLLVGASLLYGAGLISYRKAWCCNTPPDPNYVDSRGAWGAYCFLPLGFAGVAVPWAVALLAFLTLGAIAAEFASSLAGEIVGYVAAGLCGLVLVVGFVWTAVLSLVMCLLYRRESVQDFFSFKDRKNTAMGALGCMICTPVLFCPLLVAAILYFALVGTGFQWSSAIVAGLFFCLGTCPWVCALGLFWSEDDKERKLCA